MPTRDPSRPDASGRAAGAAPTAPSWFDFTRTIPAVWRAAGWYVLTGCAALACYMLRMLVHPVEMQWTLAWNGFLAMLPLVFAWLFVTTVSARRPWLRWTAPLCFIGWLLLLPNSLYLVTDLVHLVNRHWFWIDLPPYAVLAWCGIQCALLSFAVIAPTLRRWSGWGYPLVVAGILILAMMGLVAGRFIRLNSWDMLIDPGGIIASVPMHYRAISGTGVLYGFGVYAILLVLAYMPLRGLEDDSRC